MLCEKGYKTILGYECLNACLSGYLYNRGIKIDSSDIFFLGDGFLIEYDKKNKLLKANVHHSNYSFLKKYDISYTMGIHDTQNEASCFLEKCILKENQIIIRVTSNALKYNRIYNQSTGSPHCINILGRTKDSFFISDGYVPMYNPAAYSGWVPKDEIFEAWKKEEYFYIILSDDFRALAREDIISAAKVKIWEGIEKYLSCVPALPVSNDNVYGVNGLICFLDDLTERAEATNDFRKLMLDINYDLKLYGFISYRQMLYNELCKIYNEHHMINEYKTIVEKWKSWSLLLVKTGVSNRKDNLQSFISETKEIVKRENYILKTIQDLLQH